MKVRVGLLVGALLASMLVAATRGDAAPAECARVGKSWLTRPAGYLGLDESKLQKALDFATLHASQSVLVIRYGCIAGSSRLDALPEVAIEGWSMTKSVTALLVGRAVTLGKLDIDEPIGRLFPEADRAHGAITSRQLMNMSSGLHLHWIRDFHGPSLHPSRVRDALSLPFDHRPGTYWQYTQSPVTLLGEAVSRAVGRDLQLFAQRELFGPIGIARESWSWDRDRAGTSEAWAHLKMRPTDWARLGMLVLRGGRWDRRQLVSTSYMQQFTTSSPANQAYGFLTWLNGRDSYVLPGTNGRDAGEGWLVPNAPNDAIIFAGQDEQRVYVIPSLDMVVVRLGQRGSREADMRVTVWTGRAGELDNGFMYRIKLAVTDKHLDTRDRYRSAGFVVPSTAPDSWPGSVIHDPAGALAAVGAGPQAPEGCTPLGCD